MYYINQLTLLKHKLKSKFIRNTGWLLFEQVFRMIISLVVTSLIARYLGTENFGLVNYSLAYITIFITICNLGIDSIIVNEIIKNRTETGKIIGSTIFLRLIASVLSILLVYFIIRIIEPDHHVLYVITFIQSISLLLIIFDTLEYWFQSNLKSKYIVISKSVAFTIVSVWRILLVVFEQPLYYFAVATVIEATVMSLSIFIYYNRLNGPKLLLSFETVKHLVTNSFYHFIAGLLIMIYTQIDKIMLGQIVGSRTVGVYVAAMTISSLWMFIPHSIIESSRPIIMSVKSDNEYEYVKKNKQLYSLIIWIGIVAAIVITLLSKHIILFIYGNQFIESVDVLIILIWSRIFALIGTAKSIWLTVENLGKYQVYFVGIAAFLNIIFNFTLIPRFGVFGAAIASLIAEVISSFFACLLFKKTRPLFKLILESFLFKGVKN